MTTKFTSSLILLFIFAGCGSDSNSNNSESNNSESNKSKNNEQTQHNQEYISLDENGNMELDKSILDDIPKSDLSEIEKKALIFVREEEKLARDVYIYLDKRYESETKIFGNIQKAEQTHTDSVKILLDRYNIDDPMTNDEDADLGVFKNQDLQKLYNDLTSKGAISKIDAIEVGLIIEDLDIRDIEIYISQSDNEDIKTIFKSLVKGSENHLKAFYNKYEGNLYTPKYISQERYKQIISSDSDSHNGQENELDNFPPQVPTS